MNENYLIATVILAGIIIIMNPWLLIVIPITLLILSLIGCDFSKILEQ